MRNNSNLDPSKTSWDYIKKANEQKIFITVPTQNEDGKWVDKSLLPSWHRHSVGTAFVDSETMVWYRRTKDGRKEMEKDDPLNNPVTPLFCPKCGNIMKRGDLDTKAMLHTGGCFICHINEKAETNEKANIHEFKRKLKIIKEQMDKEKEQQI